MRDMESFSPVATGYVTRADVCRTFKQDMKSLYLLSLLLTAGRHSAEQCFVSSLNDCLNMRPVFKEWTDSWTRRIVLQNAIRILSSEVTNGDDGSQFRLSPLDSNLSPAFRAVCRLDTFERLVFVMTVLEGYSDHECSLLLRSSKRNVVAAKAKAVERLVPTPKRKEFLRPAPQVEHQFAARENE
jgi:hypothetical protein